MNRSAIGLGACLLVLLTGSAVVLTTDTAGEPSRPVVVCTTTHLGAIVQALAGDAVDVEVFTPAGACPGHFVLTPEAVRRAQRAALILGHGWEAYLDKLRTPGGRTSWTAIAVEGNWFCPDVQRRATGLVGQALADRLPALAAAIERNRAAHETAVQRAFAAAGDRRFAGVPVVCSFRLAEWLEALGFHVVAAYGRRGDLDPGELSDVIARARAAQARLVVDNQQSGPHTGQSLLAALDLPESAHVVLSNFPERIGGRWDYAGTVAAHGRLLRQALDSAHRP